ncbi:hypothetical protein N7461_000918 [Penicillium sp. DV-2018c]|nr:hypothetical protein N7461_000918 [Penicillium sp. DV-2018c]
MEDFTEDLLSAPPTDWRHGLEALRRDLRQDIIAGIQAVIEPPVRQTVRTYAEAAAGHQGQPTLPIPTWLVEQLPNPPGGGST